MKRSAEVLPPIAACSLAFAGVLILVSNTIGPEVAAILAAIAALVAMVLVMKVWKPAQVFRLEGDVEVVKQHKTYTAGELVGAWVPYILLVVFVLAWRYPPIQGALNLVSVQFDVPGLHNTIMRLPPLTPEELPYGASYNFNWLSAAGTSCFLAAFAASSRPRSVAGPLRRDRQGGADAVEDAAADHRVCAGGGLRDELRRHDHHPRARLRGHRGGVPVLQRDARLDGGLPDRQRTPRRTRSSARCRP